MHRSVLAALVAILALAAPALSQCALLSTSFAAGNGQSGNMFDIRDLSGSGLDIHGLEVNNLAAASAAATIFVYYRNGTHVGNEANPGAWTLHATQSITMNPAGTPTPLVFSSPISVPAGGGLFGLYVTTDGVTALGYTNGTVLGAVLATDGTLEIQEGSGVVYPFAGIFTPRFFNGSVLYSVPGLPGDWQSNSAALSIDVDGAQASVCGAAISTDNVIFGNAGSATFHLSSNLVGAPFDIAINNVPLVPLSGAGFALPSGIVNIAIGGGFTFLNGGLTPSVTTGIPGLGLGASSFSGTFGLTNVAPGTYSFQGYVLNAAAPGGVNLSQGAQYDVVAGPPPSTLPGPAGDDNSVAIDLVGNQWVTGGGMPFYGVTYSTIYVASNGRVNFVGADDDFTPVVATAITDNPFAGNWCDLSPNVGGSITVTASAGIMGDEVTVSYSAVPYFGDTQTATYDVVFNAATGQVSLNGLNGILPSTAAASQFLGLSPGNVGNTIAAAATTNSGASPFASGSSGAIIGGPGDMLYIFNDVGLGGVQHAAITAGLTSVVFTPDGAGNYTWSGF